MYKHPENVCSLLIILIAMTIPALTGVGCATQAPSLSHAQQMTISSDDEATRLATKAENPEKAKKDGNETGEKYRTPWVYQHASHRHARPSYRGQRPIVPVSP